MSDTPPRPPTPQPIPFELPPDIEIEYSNLARIAHTPAEFVFDFSLLLPGNNAARISSRIIMSPLSAKLLFRALGENLGKYETTFGTIHHPAEPTLADHLFRPTNPPESPEPGEQEE